GYSYPLLFAILMVPLAALPPTTAAYLFTALDLVGLALSVTILLAPLSRMRMVELLLLGGYAGLFTSVRGTIYFGQANLLVLPLLAIAFRGRLRAPMLALATAIKLYPAAGLVALAARGRRALGAFAASVGLTAALVVLPNLLLGGFGASGDRVAGFLEPDTFWTNQSVNGWVSRLALPSDMSTPPLPGLPVTVTMVVLALALGVLVVVLVVRRRGQPWDGCLALLIAWGVVAAPKNSLWNYTPLMLALAWCYPRVRHRPVRLLALVMGFALVEVQSRIDLVHDTFYLGSPALTWLSSVALYGALMVLGLTAYLLVREPTGSGAPAS
ncbi:MAG: DUF2029 domain-containing protein, partial [Candidatus Dormibacteraeota bacterium]|nr:DUF2029 domain-containing protein [Candidatus Dormibacteraeota bacterium]